jgi:hypothetical protein
MRVRIYQVRAALAEKLPLVDPEARGVPSQHNLAALAHPCYDSRYSVLEARCAMHDIDLSLVCSLLA